MLNTKEGFSMIEMQKGIFRSVTGQKLDRRLWLPEGEPKAVVQFVHGMAEHIDRYDAPARALAAAGYAVVGHNHLGHGPKGIIKGYFADKDGWQYLIEDVHTLRKQTESYFPGKPYFLLGHSMGSFVVRCYLLEKAEGLAGAILSGTGWYDPMTLAAGLTICNVSCLLGKGKAESNIMKNAVGLSSKGNFEGRTPCDWLSRDQAQVDKYMDDPLCGFTFTASGYRDMFRGLKRLVKAEALKAMPAELPVYFFSGDKDPVGADGVGVNKIVDMFRQAGMKDVAVKLYPDGRHEMFNELNCQEVYSDLIGWLDSK